MSSAAPQSKSLLSRAAARFGREPLVQFALAGALLFGLQAWRHPEQSAPRPRVIGVTPADLEMLRARFQRSWKRDPDRDELGDLTAEFIDDEILFREGTALHLERDDEVVRLRVIEKMRALVRPQSDSAEPTQAQLRGWFARFPHRFRQPARIAFEQLFFDRKRRASAADDARAALARLAADAPDAAPPAGLSDRFVLRERWPETPEPQVVNAFGAGFAQALAVAPLGRWAGPFDSEYGLHLVRVSQRIAARMPAFEEVAGYVRADYQMARAGSAVEQTLRPHYRIELQGPEGSALSATPALRALHPERP